MGEVLAHGGEAGNVELGGRDVVETHDRDVLGNRQSRLVEGADQAERKFVVAGEDRRGGSLPGEPESDGVSDLRVPAAGQWFASGQTGLGHHGTPLGFAGPGFRPVGRAGHMGDVGMSQVE